MLLAGIGVAGYLARHHDHRLYGDASASLANCPHTETVDCDLVNTSAWSALFGIPIAAFAIPTYLLVLFLTWRSDPRSSPLAYAFSIGLLATSASAFLFYISKTRIGFICLWCLRLYAVNIAIPILAAAAAGRSPGKLIMQTLRDLRSWPRALRTALLFFVVAVGLTVGAERGYSRWLKDRTAREIERIFSEGGPTVPAVPTDTDGGTPEGRSAAEPEDDGTVPAPAVPESEKPVGNDGARNEAGAIPVMLGSFVPWLGTAAAEAPDKAAPGAVSGPYKFAGPLRRVSSGKGGMKAEPFDLQSRLGKGKPVALIVWAPGFRESQRALVEWAHMLSGITPPFETYALAGRRADQKDEELWEAFSMLELPYDLPLVVDDEFNVSKGLDVLDVPDVALFGRDGALVVAKMKAPKQLMVLPSGNLPAEEIVRKVAAGEAVPVVRRMFPYYPATELYGRCAPAFTLKKFDSADSVTFPGRSLSGKPTMLVFWSSTCKHCQIEIPNLVAWLKEHPGKVDVVSVTHIKAEKMGEVSHRRVTEAYIKSQGITWPVLEDPDRAVEEIYRGISTPTAYFIAPDGTVTNAWFYAHEAGFDSAITAELTRASTTTAKTCRAPDAAPASKMDLQILGPDGKRVALASTVDKPTVVHFWATWCKPCAEELPSLLRFRDAIEKSGEARVVLVSVEDEAAGPQIASFEKKLGSPARSYRAPKGGLTGLIDLSYRVPRSYLLAPGAVVVGSRQGSLNWDDPATAAKVKSRLKNPGAGPPP